MAASVLEEVGGVVMACAILRRAMTRSPRLAAIDATTYRLPDELTERLFSPSLLIFMDQVRANLAQMLAYMDGDPNRWRPHLKTTKTPEVWRELILAGIRNFKCATPREAEVLLTLLDEMAVTDADLLVAYPMVGPNLERIAALATDHPTTRVSVLSEDPAHAAVVPAHLGVFVDINPQMNRTGIPMVDGLAIAAVAHAATTRLRGLHFYDGHVRDPEVEVRERRCWELYDRLLEILAQLQADGLTIDELITSGTPAFPYALSHEGLQRLAALPNSRTVHRVSPGTVVFHDAFSDDLLQDVELQPAAVLFTRVVSCPAPGLVTCDAGSKSIAAEAGDPVAFVLGHPHLVAQRPSEEHLPLRIEGGEAPARGAPLLLVPRHVCPTVNLAESALLLEMGTAPRVVTIAARAHELLLQRTTN